MQQFEFRLLENDTYGVMGYTGDEPEVTVPETYARKPVTLLFDDLFSGHTEITSVTLPATVTDLGEFLFEGCTGLRHITLPESLSSIWPYAFARSGLEEITLPDGLTSIAPFTFQSCHALEKVVCGAGMEVIHAGAFGDCPRLKEVLHGPQVDMSPRAFESLRDKPAP